jgi:hypothetical protein
MRRTEGERKIRPLSSSSGHGLPKDAFRDEQGGQSDDRNAGI